MSTAERKKGGRRRPSESQRREIVPILLYPSSRPDFPYDLHNLFVLSNRRPKRDTTNRSSCSMNWLSVNSDNRTGVTDAEVHPSLDLWSDFLLWGKWWPMKLRSVTSMEQSLVPLKDHDCSRSKVLIMIDLIGTQCSLGTSFVSRDGHITERRADSAPASWNYERQVLFEWSVYCVTIYFRETDRHRSLCQKIAIKCLMSQSNEDQVATWRRKL